MNPWKLRSSDRWKGSWWRLSHCHGSHLPVWFSLEIQELHPHVWGSHGYFFQVYTVCCSLLMVLVCSSRYIVVEAINTFDSWWSDPPIFHVCSRALIAICFHCEYMLDGWIISYPKFADLKSQGSVPLWSKRVSIFMGVPHSWTIYKGKSQSKWDDDWGYP